MALARKYKMGDSYVIPEAVDAGSLMSFGVDIIDLFRRSTGHVDKILRGAKPGQLAMELPTKYDLVLNKKTAKALGLTIPKSLRMLADRIVE